MSGDAVVMIAAIIGAAIIVFAVISKRRSADGVDSFRRQIDALSPEARKPVVDQVKGVADRHARDDDPDPDDDEDDVRGT